MFDSHMGGLFDWPHLGLTFFPLVAGSTRVAKSQTVALS